MKISCPHCGQHYEVDDNTDGTILTCEGCWKDFTVSSAAAEPPPAAAKPSAEPTISRCPFCGGEIMPGVKKCRHCGEWLEKTISLPVKKSKDPVIYVLLGLFGGVIALHNFYEGKSMLGFAKISTTILGLYGLGMLAAVPQFGLLLMLPMFVIFCRNMYEITHCEKMLSR